MAAPRRAEAFTIQAKVSSRADGGAAVEQLKVSMDLYRHKELHKGFRAQDSRRPDCWRHEEISKVSKTKYLFTISMAASNYRDLCNVPAKKEVLLQSFIHCSPFASAAAHWRPPGTRKLWGKMLKPYMLGILSHYHSWKMLPVCIVQFMLTD